MPYYVQRGNIPPKRHIQHRSSDGELYHEELAGREGFSDIYSNIYHIYPPTRIAKVGELTRVQIEPANDGQHRHRHLETYRFPPRGNWLSGRRALAFNNDVTLYSLRPEKPADFFYRNGIADEVIFVHEGEGTLYSYFGKLEFKPWDYIVVPKGILYRIEITSRDSRFFIIEATGPVEVPRRYRNEYGQLLEHAPFCERDFRVPEFMEPVDQKGEFRFLLRTVEGLQEYHYAHHPFDVVGWDGFYYPWIFNMKDFMPITGKIHQPPPVHQTFQAPGFVICSFCPRLFDYHELAIPAPYNHHNVDSDEVLYYVEGDFMSRKGVSKGSITIHPYGLAHGPQPGKYEGSIGKKETNEWAVMVDTFRPLIPTKESLEVDDPGYPFSWLE
ncbi:MAG: homogentisate 1,2-dioxygenase [Methanobacteriota archaeon]|nr:MAG: homogentisate 1,2-dioxygenase [Euryarchaeota archaeon]